MKKVVLKLHLHNDEQKQKALTTAYGHPGVESITMEMKDEKLTVTGNIESYDLVKKLKGKKEKRQVEILKVWPAEDENPNLSRASDPAEMKVVLKLHLHNDEQKQKALTIAYGHPGVESFTMDMKDVKLTVTGNFDPFDLVIKLREGERDVEILTWSAKDENPNPCVVL